MLILSRNDSNMHTEVNAFGLLSQDIFCKLFKTSNFMMQTNWTSHTVLLLVFNHRKSVVKVVVGHYWFIRPVWHNQLLTNL